jgi:hypothetical protein
VWPQEVEVTTERARALARRIGHFFSAADRAGARLTLQRACHGRASFVTRQDLVLDGPAYLRARALLQSALNAAEIGDTSEAARLLNDLADYLGAQGAPQ